MALVIYSFSVYIFMKIGKEKMIRGSIKFYTNMPTFNVFSFKATFRAISLCNVVSPEKIFSTEIMNKKDEKILCVLLSLVVFRLYVTLFFYLVNLFSIYLIIWFSLKKFSRAI